jgi:hypothetical protein
MTSMKRQLSAGAAVLAAWVLPSCSLLTDAPLTTARIEVDPTPVRTIQYLTSDGWSEPEVTTERLDEIDCLRATPACHVTESITATVHNTGADRLEFYWPCESLVDEFGDGEWHRTPYICSAVTAPPLVIAPGESHTFSIGMGGRHAAEYRFRADLRDAAGMQLPDRMRISEPFRYQPLPDRTFVCPNANEAERAKRLAREALERAALGPYPMHGDALMLRLESEVPGIGGLFLDNTISRMGVWVTDESNFYAAETALEAVLRRSPVARKGRFGFSELVAWRSILQDYLPVVPGYFRLGHSDVSNRIALDMGNPLYLPEVECIARGIGMPAGILEVEASGSVWVFE